MKTLTLPSKLTLATLTLAVAASLALIAPAQAMGPWHGGSGHHAAMAGGDGGLRMGERMLDRIKATPEQRSQIRAIQEAARKDLQAQREAGRALREQRLQLFTQPNVDANAAEALRQKQLAQFDQASKRRMQAMLDASRVLTPEQRAQLASDFQKRRDLRERHFRERRALEAPKT